MQVVTERTALAPRRGATVRLAHGHQERHPLRVKMSQLEDVMARVRGGEDLDRVLSDGCQGDNALSYLLCEDLRPRWEKARKGA